MYWEFKYRHLFGAKIWLDVQNNKILLSEAYGRSKKIFDFDQVRNVETGKARTSSNYAIFFTMNDLKKPEYTVEFGRQTKRDEWFKRLNVALDMKRYK